MLCHVNHSKIELIVLIPIYSSIAAAAGENFLDITSLRGQRSVKILDFRENHRGSHGGIGVKFEGVPGGGTPKKHDFGL